VVGATPETIIIRNAIAVVACIALIIRNAIAVAAGVARRERDAAVGHAEMHLCSAG
jgi:hypothetical protein